MIARVDVAAKFRSPDLKPFNKFPDYGVTAKFCWTKIQKKSGSRQRRFCLGFELNPEENTFYFRHKGATALTR